MKLSKYILITVNVCKGLTGYILSFPPKCMRVCVHVPHCEVCLCIQWELKHKWTVNFVFTKAFTAVLPLSFCWGQQRVSKHSRVWHRDAAWISGQRLSVHWEGEGGSVPRLKACLFDIAFPRHLTALSVFSCKACITLSFRAYSRCVCMLVFLSMCVLLHLPTYKGLMWPMKC